MTVGQAIDRYIESKSAVLSPATIRGYRQIRRNCLKELMDVRLPMLTQEMVQRAVNRMAKPQKGQNPASPKSIRNAHGLLSAALSVYRPGLVLRTTLPQKTRHEVNIPTGEEIDRIFAAVRGTRAELSVALAIWLGLRMSEIRGLQWDCLEGDVLHIKQALVDTDDGPTLKATKTYSGDRYLHVPPYIMDLIDQQDRGKEYIIPHNGHIIYLDFIHACQKAGLPHYRFHDLRHANASVMLALGIPDKYAMERMGHATTNMLKTVYQHTMKSKSEEVAQIVDQYFEEKLHTDLHT